MTTPPPNNGWADRISFSSGPEPIAYRPRDVIVPFTAASRTREVVRDFFGPDDEGNLDELRLGRGEEDEPGRRNPLVGFTRFRGVADPLLVVRELQAEGIDAQPNHVFFAHCGDCCGPHPAQLAMGGGPNGSPVYATPVYATPVYATPVYATPVYATPVYATPVYATGEMQATGKRRSSTKPVGPVEAADMMERLADVPAQAQPNLPISAMVLDVGCSVPTFRGDDLGDVDPMSTADDTPDDDNDQHLDPVAGHGEFIAGLIKSIAPQSRVAVRKVLRREGDGDEEVISTAVDALPDVRPSGGAVLNLSFGGYALNEKALLLASSIRDAQARGWVVVASAGNDGVCRRTYPAGLPDVIGVGAIGPSGPAPFTNYGPWVRACAPGVDLVSTFFDRFTADVDLGPFEGWARWSGTSFSAPIVAGAIVAQMLAAGTTAQVAAARVVDAPELLRLTGLGAVVNRV